MNKINYKIFIVFLVIVQSVLSCSKGGKPVAEPIEVESLASDIVELRADQITLAKIELGSIERRSIGNKLKVNGVVTVAPQNLATVCMPLGGFIKNTTLFPGNAINKGQTLAVIENQEFVDIQQNYLEAKNKLVFAEAEYKRHTALFKDEVYSEQNVQQVTVEYKNLKALIKSLEQKLDLIGIKPDHLTEDNISNTVNLISPIRGYLKSVNINIGKYVSSTDVLFEIVNCDNLLLELTLFEKDASRISFGQNILFYINDEKEEHTAVISQTGRSVTADRTLRVFANITATCKNLLPGMYVSAFIQESDSLAEVVPNEAVVSFDDKDYVFIYEKEKVEDGKPFTEYRMIEVQKGASADGFTVISVGQAVDIKLSRIVVKGAYNLLSAKKNAGEMAC